MAEDQALSYPAIRSLVVASTEGEMKVTLSAAVDHTCDGDPFVSTSSRKWCWDHDVPFQIVVHQDRLTVADAVHRIVGNIYCSISLLNVQDVHVVGPPSSPVFWREILGHVEGVRYLKLSEGVMPDLAPILSLALRDHGTDLENRDGLLPGRPTCVPELEMLELRDIVFSLPLETYTHAFPADVQSLCDALSIRKEPGGQLIVAQCTECNSDYEEEEFDMSGWWEGGRFHLVDKHA